MGACTVPGCKTMLTCKTGGEEIPFGQVESWSHNSSREESEGSYIAGTCIDPQPDPAVDDVSSYIELNGVYYESCDSSSSCTDEISIQGKYCMDLLNGNVKAQRCLKCNTLIELCAYQIEDDNSTTLLWNGTGTVQNKNRTFPGGTETATFDSTISFEAGALVIPPNSPYC